MKRSFLYHFAAALVVVMILTGSSVQAQTHTPPSTTEANIPTWVTHLGAQLSAELQSPVEAIRQDALRHIVYFAQFYPDNLDLTATLPHLFDIYQRDEQEQLRLFAVAAIHSIGDEEGMQKLRRLVTLDFKDQMSMRVQLVSMAALTAYYGTDTFKGDDQAIQLARDLLEYYTNPRVIVEPPSLIEW